MTSLAKYRLFPYSIVYWNYVIISGGLINVALMTFLVTCYLKVTKLRRLKEKLINSSASGIPVASLLHLLSWFIQWPLSLSLRLFLPRFSVTVGTLYRDVYFILGIVCARARIFSKTGSLRSTFLVCHTRLRSRLFTDSGLVREPECVFVPLVLPARPIETKGILSSRRVSDQPSECIRFVIKIHLNRFTVWSRNSIVEDSFYSNDLLFAPTTL